MPEYYTKLFSSILRSTIWSESTEVRVVWITLLAMSDRNGYVGASIPGLARDAGVSIEVVEAALAKFMAPDTYSRSQEYEGRRLEVVDRGWRLLNYERFRNLRDEEERRVQVKEAVRRHRAKKAKEAPNAVISNQSVIHGKPRKAHAEAEAYTEAEVRESPKKETLARSDADIAPERLYPIVGKGAEEPWVLPDGKTGEWGATYPGVDVPAALLRARQWLIDNPGRRKTSRGMLRYLNSWLEHEQNRGGGLFRDRDRQPPRARPGQPANTDRRRPIVEDEP